MDFGSGAVKITPAHDQNDFEIGIRHDLERILVMNEDGSMNKLAGTYEGMDRFECRKANCKRLTGNAAFYSKSKSISIRSDTQSEAVQSSNHICQRNGSLKCNHSQMKPSISKKHEGKVNFVPDRFEKTYLNGWKTSTTGVFHVSFGGDIVSRLGTILKQAKSMLVMKHRQTLKTGNKMKMSWIHGSHQRYGHSQQ